MTLFLILIGFFLLLLIMGKINWYNKFDKSVKELFLLSKKNHQFYNSNQLEGLPQPVQQYFRLVLKEQQPYISYARIKHTGKFKAGLKSSWMKIKGEQYATTTLPGFIWKGITALLVASDSYLADKGRLSVYFLSFYKMLDAKNKKEYNQSELLRWLGESLLYPTNLLPSERLHWLPIDEVSAKMVFNYNGLSLYFIVTFNKKGEIISLETKRYMNANQLETWIINALDYREINNILIPTFFNVNWRLNNRDFSYAQFNITTVEYNIPEQF